ncbi:cell division protein ZapA [Brevundimonas sp.]|uniref:cell division protein ZapA n=1 Tax=Brevundimonas sp. TaxID=1871086 RepID=UPI001DEA6C83|nr:cell division protein ZapA [Brevundimonas sp.]MBL0948373.1 cell division protein ZapA [Brevundimonas sp.]
MATVTVEINGRPYAVGCADGQEDRVKQLAAQFAGHVSNVAAEVGHVGELRLFLMAGLILADELQEARSGEAPVRPAEPPPADAGVAEALNAVAARIEKIAQSIT